MQMNCFDIYTVVLKELTELIALTTVKKTVLRIIAFIAFVGVFFPLFWGKGWMNSYIIIYFWSWFGCFLIIGPAGNAIVRERSAGTLETLLTSQIPNYAISMGKLLSAFLYSFSIVLCGIVVGSLSISLKEGSLMWYDSKCFIYGIVISILLMTLWGNLVFLLSLHARDPLRIMQLVSLVSLALISPGVYIRVTCNSYTLLQFDELVNSFFAINWLIIPLSTAILAFCCGLSCYCVLIKVTRKNLMNEK